jgi:ligand-binding sensor domain-containing protein
MNVFKIDPLKVAIVLVGSWYGLAEYDGKRWQTHDKRDGMPDDWITSMAFDAKGELWCGTRLKGMLHYDGASWEMFSTDDGIANEWVKSILVDNQNRKWLATGSGMSLYTGDQKHPMKIPW